MNAAELFAKMDACFNAEAASGINAIFQCEFSDDDNYYIVIEDGTKDIQKGDHDAPTVTITTDIGALVGSADGSAFCSVTPSGKITPPAMPSPSSISRRFS